MLIIFVLFIVDIHRIQKAFISVVKSLSEIYGILLQWSCYGVAFFSKI